jgi:hypothetical protein
MRTVPYLIFAAFTFSIVLSQNTFARTGNPFSGNTAGFAHAFAEGGAFSFTPNTKSFESGKSYESGRLIRWNDRRETQTLLSGGVRHGGFGAPVYGVTSINGQPVYLRGTRGAWVINLDGAHAIHLGLAGYRTRTDADLTGWSHSDIEEPQLRTDYGGFEIEYVASPYRLVHVGTQLLIGSGNARYDDRDLDVGNTRDNYFVLQPGVNLMLNVTRWFRISGGVYYRYVSGVNLEGTGDTDLSGPAGFLGLRFGKF